MTNIKKTDDLNVLFDKSKEYEYSITIDSMQTYQGIINKIKDSYEVFDSLINLKQEFLNALISQNVFNSELLAHTLSIQYLLYPKDVIICACQDFADIHEYSDFLKNSSIKALKDNPAKFIKMCIANNCQDDLRRKLEALRNEVLKLRKEKAKQINF